MTAIDTLTEASDETQDEAEPRAKRRQPPPDTLWVTDAEIIRRLGVPEKIAYLALHRLDADPRSNFPRKQALWGGRRYWPAVRHYFDYSYDRVIPNEQRRAG